MTDGTQSPGLRASINKKCYDCIHDPIAAGSRAVQVELCSCYDCPLWDVRPVRNRNTPDRLGRWISDSVAEYYMLSEADRARIERNPRERPPHIND